MTPYMGDANNVGSSERCSLPLIDLNTQPWHAQVVIVVDLSSVEVPRHGSVAHFRATPEYHCQTMIEYYYLKPTHALLVLAICKARRNGLPKEYAV